MPDYNGQPAYQADSTAADANAAQNTTEVDAASQVESVEVSNEVRSYLKGLGMGDITVTADMARLAEAGMKQKNSVSRLSQEKEQLLARLSSQGADTTVAEPEYNTYQEEVTAPATQDTQAKTGVSDNDLFRLSQSIHDRYKELIPAAEDGSLFRELRQLGYFGANGINERDVHAFLAQKNAGLQELRELREFKDKYSKPNASVNPSYNPQPGLNLDGPMNDQLAHQIIYSGDYNNKRFAEARAFLQKGIIEHRGF